VARRRDRSSVHINVLFHSGTEIDKTVASNHSMYTCLLRATRTLDDFLARPQKDQSKDEFETYIRQTPCAVDPLIQFDLIEWWWNNQGTFPTLYQMRASIQ